MNDKIQLAAFMAMAQVANAMTENYEFEKKDDNKWFEKHMSRKSKNKRRKNKKKK
jgi:hypothetical protein